MVHFVGAGPGAPDLITRRGAALLQTADCIIYAGSLVNPALLGLAGAGRPGRPLGLPPLPGGLPPGRAGRAGPAPAGGPLAGRLPRGRLLICAGVDVDKLVALPRVLLPAFLSQGAFPPFHIPKFFQGAGSPTSRTRAPKDAKFPARFS